MTPILTRPTGIGSNKSIEDLLRRRFGSLAPQPVPTLQNPRSVEIRERNQAIEAARAEYEAMTPAQLQNEIEKARREDAEIREAKAAEEEQSMFFHKPYADADFKYWGKMPLWTLEEAVALSLGKDPGVVNWSSVNGSDGGYILASLQKSPFRAEYGRRRELAGRAAAAYELSDPVKPEAFLTWSLKMFDSLPAGLIEQVRAMGKRVGDLNASTKRIAELEAELAAFRNATPAAPAEDADKPLDRRERTTLLTIIGALAAEAGIDLTRHNKAGEALAAKLDEMNVKLNGRTIGDHLRAVREAMDSRQVK